MNRAARLSLLLKVRPGEANLVALVTGLMLVVNAGGAIGSPGVEALFYTRFGVDSLPIMYILLGIVSPLTSILMTSLISGARLERMYILLPVLMALLLVAARLLLLLELSWFYAVLWLAMNVFWIVQGLFIWGSAGYVCDTRQAKRLFPLFGVGGIVGLSLGGLLTDPLVALANTENLLLVWAGGLLLGSLLIGRLMTTRKPGSTTYSPAALRGSLVDEFRQGLRVVRQTPLLSWMARAAVLFAVLYYGVVFPFARGVTAQFSSEAEVASFLGTFQGIATGFAALVSLFVANRLYSRFGFMTLILVYPLIYLAGFAVSAIGASFTVLVVFRFAQIFWSEGVSEGANQAMFNVVPPDSREKARAFIRGVANQFGVSLAGLLLLLSDRVLPGQALFVIGAGAAALCATFVWQARRSYGGALVDALRAGQSHIFFSEEQPFGGFEQDAQAVRVALEGVNSPEVQVRRVSAEILGNLSLPEATRAIVDALDDEDATVRVALLRALGSAQAAPALLEVAARLRDPEPEVREQAVNTLANLARYPQGLRTHLQPMLDDPDPGVRSSAALALLQSGPHPAAEEVLMRMASQKGRSGEEINSRILALQALAQHGGDNAYDLAAEGLQDPLPAVRRVSARLISRIDPERCLFPLQVALGDEDESVRNAAAEALGKIGEPALAVTVAALGSRKLEAGALLALRGLPARKARTAIEEYISGQVERALHYQRLWHDSEAFIRSRLGTGGLRGQFQLGLEVLIDSLHQMARRHGGHALLAMGVIGRGDPVYFAVENLDSDQRSQQANALETLDSVGDRVVVRRLLPIWEAPPDYQGVPDNGWIRELLHDEDSWLRACAAFVACHWPGRPFGAELAQIAEQDADELVRESAGLAGEEGDSMETLKTLSTMERVLFLRQVPLFVELPPADLKQIAMIAGERAFADGSILAEQGQAGDELYIIVSGEVVVSVGMEDGGRRELGRRVPGEYVGEMAIISDEVRMARMAASGDVRALSIGQSAFHEIIRLRPEAALAVMRELCERVRQYAG